MALFDSSKSRYSAEESLVTKNNLSQTITIAITNPNKINELADIEKAVKKITGYLPEDFKLSLSSEYTAPAQSFIKDMPIIGSMENFVSAFSGNALATTGLTAQVWQGCSVDDFSVSFVLDEAINWRNEKISTKSIVDELKFLISLSSPTVDDNFLLKTPGAYFDLPSIGNQVAEQLKKEAAARNSRKTTTGEMRDSSKAPTEQDADQNAAIQGRSNFTAESFKKYIKGRNVSVRLGKYMFFPSVVITRLDATARHDIDWYSHTPQSYEINLSFRPLFLPTLNDWNKMIIQPQNVNTEPQQLAVNGGGIIDQLKSKVTGAIGGITDSATSWINKL